MKTKYGDEAVAPLHVWVIDFGFPRGGTLSMEKLMQEKIDFKIK